MAKKRKRTKKQEERLKQRRALKAARMAKHKAYEKVAHARRYIVSGGGDTPVTLKKPGARTRARRRASSHCCRVGGR